MAGEDRVGEDRVGEDMVVDGKVGDGQMIGSCLGSVKAIFDVLGHSATPATELDGDGVSFLVL